jgi:hypothetical protein
MTPQEHPSTPPPELVWEWTSLANEEDGDEVWISITTQAARWGSDQELEACCEWLEKHVLGPNSLGRLRAARRPKPPTLKEQALKALKVIEFEYVHSHSPSVVEATTGTIRRALEALPND